MISIHFNIVINNEESIEDARKIFLFSSLGLHGELSGGRGTDLDA